ncbi:MAG: FHA domain-containing serine/threonine-protein kinase [Actinomycetota bacterium]
MKTFANYRLVREMAAGNHGTFHLAHPPADLGLDQDTVAIKILDRHASDNEFKRMAAELQILLDLNHPHLVPVLDAGHDQGRLYYTTPYYPDGGLGAGPATDPRLVATVVADAAEAVHALHDRGVAHRDIKPSNILLADGRGRLADLGVANYLDARFTATGARPVGTLIYSDPRLIHGDSPGRSSDIWSLGAALHMALTGHSLIGEIPNSHLAEAIEYVLNAEPLIHPSCPPALAAVIGRAAQVDRLDRHPTAEEFAAELRAFAAEPGAAPRLSSPTAAVDDDEAASGFPLHRRAPTPDLAPYAYPIPVIGARSGAGHFNHPEARHCRVTGQPRTEDGSWISERRTRPPLGVLVDDEGRSVVVQWELVIGRKTEVDPAVAEGTAQGVDHPDQVTMSRVHVRIAVDGWDVRAVDESSNGTGLRRDGETTPLPTGEPVPLRSGDQLIVEGRTYHFHSTVDRTL